MAQIRRVVGLLMKLLDRFIITADDKYVSPQGKQDSSRSRKRRLLMTRSDTYT